MRRDLDGHAVVRIEVDDETISAIPGETVAAALYAAGLYWLRSSPGRGTPRGAFCMTGVCQECAVLIDGTVVPSCQVPVREGQVIRLARDDG